MASRQEMLAEALINAFVAEDTAHKIARRYGSDGASEFSISPLSNRVVRLVLGKGGRPVRELELAIDPEIAPYLN